MSLVYKLLYTEEAKKQISKLDSRTKEKVRIALEEISLNPETGKPLTRELKGRWSYRVGDCRIIYRMDYHQVIVIVLTVGHRRDVYEKMSRKNW